MKEKIQNFSNIFVKLLLRLIFVGIICFILFNIGKSVWKNYQVVQKIESIQNEITAEEAANFNLNNLIVYYQTDSYKELEARRKLGYKKPGENVVIIPEIAQTNSNHVELPSEENIENKKESSPNYIKWYHYVLKK